MDELDEHIGYPEEEGEMTEDVSDGLDWDSEEGLDSLDI